MRNLDAPLKVHVDKEECFHSSHLPLPEHQTAASSSDGGHRHVLRVQNGG